MPQPRSLPALPRAASAVGAVGLVGLACLLLAGVPASVHVALFCGAVAVLLLFVVERVRRRRAVRVSLLGLPLLIGAVLTTASLAPLPHALRSLLSPESSDRLDRVAPLLQPEHAQAILPALAFDPPEAALALLRLLIALVVVVVVAQQSRDRRDRIWVYRAILVCAFVVGAAVLFSTAVGIPRFFEVVGVPVNPNHRARVCGALALLCLGRALTLRPRVEATWFGVAGVVCALLVFATLSKGGIAALVVGLVTLAAVVRAPAGASGSVRMLTPLAGAIVVCAGLFAVGERGLDLLTHETLDHPERLKTFLWEPASRLAFAEPVVGVGNNGFGVAFPAVLQVGELDANLTYSHAENIVLQSLCDHGIVGGGLLLLVVIGLALMVARSLHRQGEWAAVPALVFLLVGDVFDFVLETPAGIGLAAIALGLLAGRLAAHRPALVSLPPAAAVVAVVVVVAWGAVVGPRAVRGWRYAVDADVAAAAPSVRADLLEQALAAHPSDATYATQLAIEARRRRDPQAALRFANRAMVLWPAFHAAHLEAARALFALQHARQGMLEYREVWRVTGPRAIFEEVVARTADPALRRLALPQPERAVDVATLCDVLVREGRLELARACAADAAGLPDATDVHQRRTIELALTAGDIDDAKTRLQQLTTPHDGEAAVLAARVSSALEGAPAALSTTATWIASARDPRPLLEWRLAEQRSARLFDDAEVTLLLLRPLSRNTAQATGYDLALVDLRRQRGDTVGALSALRSALGARPTDLSLLLAKVRLEVSSGDVASASLTLRQMRGIAASGPLSNQKGGGDKRVDAAEKLLHPTSP